MADAIILGRGRRTTNYAKDWEYTTNDTTTLVTKYIGTRRYVTVPNKIEGKPIVLQNSPTGTSGVFTNNRNILSVDFSNGVSVANERMGNMFYNCRSIQRVVNIPNSVTDMAYTFYSCSNLTQAPEIPNSVNSMFGTFSYCNNLTQAPNIPNSVNSMYSTFSYCTNLTQAPNIPNRVTNMANTFFSCANLTLPPNIPNSVTDMAYTFRYCTNLTGSIIIRSENITNFRNCFYNTNASKIKKVYIPYKYANGVNTKTYNAAFNSSYGINGKNGVTVYDINTYTG